MQHVALAPSCSLFLIERYYNYTHALTLLKICVKTWPRRHLTRICNFLDINWPRLCLKNSTYCVRTEIFLCAFSSPPPHILVNTGPTCRTRKARLQPGDYISERHRFSNMGPGTIRRFQALQPGGETPASSRFYMLNKPQKGDVCISLVETKCGKILPS